MNDGEMRDKINSITRWIAYKIYPKAGSMGKFVKAYDKLSAKVFADHDLNINKLLESTKNIDKNLFTVLSRDELKMVLTSAESLQKMYSGVMDDNYI